MEPKFQTSFIPKKPIVASEGVGKKSVDFFMMIATLLFLGSIVLSAGVYAYKILLDSRIQTLQSSLAKSSDAFDQDAIGNISRLNTRIEVSKDLLSKHLSTSAIFGFLASHTLKTISYADFSYSYGSDGSIKVVLKGLAENYSSIALQSEEFGKQNQYIKSPIFSDLNPDQTGSVVFTLTALLDKNLISYAKNQASMKTAIQDSGNTTSPDSAATTSNIQNQ